MRTNVKLRLLSVLLAVVLCATMLTACGGSKLDGTYHSQGLISQSFTFDGDQVTMSARIGSRVIKSSSRIPCLVRNTLGSNPFRSREM